MHELSMTASIVDAVTESVAAYPGATVRSVRLRVGVLSDLQEDSLQFCWGLTVDGTPLAGALLEVEMVPVLVHCDQCDDNVAIESLQSFRCPRCGQPASSVVQGREMEIDSIEIDDESPDPNPGEAQRGKS
jgi:hydrogenase nickel incorporation protein HypA/HybF